MADKRGAPARPIRPLLALFLPPLAVVLAVTVWPTTWRHLEAEGRPVRIQRLTNEVQFLRNGRWTVFGSRNAPGVNPSEANPTAAELAQVTLKEVRVLYGLPNGLVTGLAYNPLSRPLTGDVVFHLFVKRKAGGGQERELRGSVSWPPRQTSTFEIRTGLSLPEGDLLQVELRPAPAR